MFKEFFRKKSEYVLKRSAFEKVAQINNNDGCKRAVGFFPDTAKRTPELRDTVTLRFHHLLVSLEGLERTGCLKVTSHGSRSRSAILLYKGRVVGCVYGRKNMRGQYLQKDAHKYALADLASPGNILDAYELPEELVLAAASLFYGETLQLDPAQSLAAIFDSALSSLMRSGLPGTVVVNTYNEETVCIIYVAQGKIVGVFSAQDGWTHGTAESVKRFLNGANGSIHASILPVFDPTGVGFSLSGLADRAPARIENTPYLDFSPAPQKQQLQVEAPAQAPQEPAMPVTPAREAVAQALRQHRTSAEYSRGRVYAGIS